MKTLVTVCLFALFIFSCNKQNKPLQIDELLSTSINGIKQTILIQSKDTTGPVVLFLHGGPGYTSIAETHFYSKELLNHATFVHWDQRGAGYSYNHTIDTSTMNVSQLVEDTRAVSEYLKNRFKKDKIYLVGHSWGSILGCYVVQKYPELYHAYFAMGVVVSNDLNKVEQVKYMNELLEKEKDTLGLRIINEKKEVPFDLLWKYNLVFHQNYKYDSIVATSKYYSTHYKALQDSGIAFSVKFLEKALNTSNLLPFLNYKMPVYFFQGKYDCITTTSLAKNYFDLISAPEKEFVLFENSAHLPNFDEPEKFQKEIITRLK